MTARRHTQSHSGAQARIEEAPGGVTLVLEGRLDADSTGAIWRQIDRALGHEQGRTGALVVEAAAVTYCDGAGIALLVDLHRRQTEAGGRFELRGLAERYASLLALFDKAGYAHLDVAEARQWHLTSDIGMHTVRLWRDVAVLISFVGELTFSLAQAIWRPRSLRWKDMLRVMESAGVNALPIVGLIGFLMGLIMAFQAFVSFQQFGLEVYAADLVAKGLSRELGALMTAIVLAGRSGSAFAAELGTMKINEEIDALKTMALEPVRFLVAPRVIAAVVVTPLLTVFAIFAGLVGGAVVVLLRFPLVTFVNHARAAMTLTDLLGGLVKALVFGLLVAGIGCLRGLRAGQGASAVGAATTSAVVSGIVLIVVADGVFAVIYYALGI